MYKRHWFIDLAWGRAILPVAIVALLVVASGSPALAKQTWLSCSSTNDDTPVIFMWDSRMFYYYYVTSTNRTLDPLSGEDNGIRTSFSATSDELSFSNQSTDPTGLITTDTTTINRVNLTYSRVVTVSNGYYRVEGQGVCTIIPPQPLGLTAKQQF